MIIALLYRAVLGYTERTAELEHRWWDVTTCTPADYTIQIKMTDTMHAKYEEGLGDGRHLKEVIRRAVETHVRGLPVVLDGKEDDPIEVAAISFGMKNGVVIKELIKRGALYANGRYDLVAEMDELLEKWIRRGKKQDELSIPVCAFVTFATQEGYERCAKRVFTAAQKRRGNAGLADRLTILDEVAEVDAAPEPSNIIWQNLEKSRKT